MIENTSTSTLTIRRLDAADRDALERLAQLDSGSAPQAPVIGAVMEGRLVAAVSLASGEALADPFSRTAELQALLELRATQLRNGDGEPGRARRLHALARPRAALAG